MNDIFHRINDDLAYSSSVAIGLEAVHGVKYVYKLVK